ncbi:MAG: DUF1826 domain-containing protein [Pseudomonadota bacterium]
MSLAAFAYDDFGLGVETATSIEGLTQIHRPDCAAVVWNRTPLARFQTWIDGLSPNDLPSARIIIPPHAVREAVVKVFDMAGTPECPERALLADDIAALAHAFAGIASAPFLRVRLDVAKTDACRKFHVDAVKVRLICTYRGPGTQYGFSTDGTGPEHILVAPTGAPMVLRGDLWPETPRFGLLHRSPPMSGSGDARLVLVLDPAEAPDAEPVALR